MKRTFTFFFLVLFVTPFLCWSETRDFSALDVAARQIPKLKSIQDVTEAIKKISHDDWEKARAAYDWVALHIAYDTDSFFNGTETETSPEGVFRTGKSVCQGYSELYASIAEGLGIEAVVIPGYAKAYGYRIGQKFQESNHAWNAVKLDGTWHLIDTTWGSGHVDESLKFQKDFTTAWFDTDPQIFVYNHFPEEKKWLLFDSSLTLSGYEKMALIEAYGIELFVSMGFDAKKIAAIARYSPLPPNFEFFAKAFVGMGGKPDEVLSFLASGKAPQFYEYAGYEPVLVDYARESPLKDGKTYHFEVKVPGCDKAAVITAGNQFTFLEKKGDVFSGTVKAKRGTLTLSANIKYKNQLSYWPLGIWPVK